MSAGNSAMVGVWSPVPFGAAAAVGVGVVGGAALPVGVGAGEGLETSGRGGLLPGEEGRAEMGEKKNNVYACTQAADNSPKMPGDSHNHTRRQIQREHGSLL